MKNDPHDHVRVGLDLKLFITVKYPPTCTCLYMVHTDIKYVHVVCVIQWNKPLTPTHLSVQISEVSLIQA